MMGMLDGMGFLGGTVPKKGKNAGSSQDFYMMPQDAKGLLPWLFGNGASGGIRGMPANFWGHVINGGSGGGIPGGGDNGGGGGGGTTPPTPTPWQYPGLLQAPYLTTNWFGKE
jgi:hypothetical protein